MSAVLRNEHGVELVALTADEANDDRPIFVIRQTGDTAELFSDYDEDAAREQFTHEAWLRATGRTA